MLSNNNSKVFYRELLIALLCQGIHLFTITTINIINYQLSSKNAREMQGSRPARFCKPGSKNSNKCNKSIDLANMRRST